MSENAPPMLITDALTKRFGATLAVDHANLTVARGELVCLLGPSGCGKSTLLRMVAGLTESDRGAIRIDGADMTAASANRRPTAMVFQSHALWTHMSVARNVAFGLRVRRRPSEEIASKVAAALDLVGLKGYEARFPTQLSGGQAQRVALARCLVVEPKLLLMDEPFSALDAHLRQRLREELKLLQHRLGLTILFVTHDQEEAMEIADRIVVMNNGRLEQTGRPGDLYAAPATAFVAGFIGLMNIGPAHVRAGWLDWHGMLVPTDQSDGEYLCAVRPEDIDLLPTGGVLARVERIVDLGPLRRFSVRTMQDVALKVQMPASADGGEMAGATLRFAPRRLHLYRGETLAATIDPNGGALAAA